MDDEVRLTIGEAARAAGVSAKAVRLWEAKGLVPAPERTRAGYRAFTTADVAVLQFIRQAKALGFTLAEIKAILDAQVVCTEPCDRVKALIDGHIAAIDRTLAELQQRRQTLLTARSRATRRCCTDLAPSICRIIEGATASQSAR